MKYFTSIKLILACSILTIFQLQNSYGQMVITEIKAVYKSKMDNRIISEEEFQSFKGRHLFHKLIKGKRDAIDTILISPPTGFTNESSSLLNKKAPEFSVTDIYGHSYSLDQLKGKVIVMNFWFVACPPCIQEIPELNDLATTYQSHSDIIFLAFAKDTRALLGMFLSHTAFEYAVIPNASNIAKEYGVHAFPTHIIMDQNGIVRYSAVGFKEGSIKELKSKINQILM